MQYYCTPNKFFGNQDSVLFQLDFQLNYKIGVILQFLEEKYSTATSSIAYMVVIVVVDSR